jgi:hypothetical protein
VSMRLHSFAALMLRDFCFPSFFKGAHSDFVSPTIEPSNSPQRKCTRASLSGPL